MANEALYSNLGDVVESEILAKEWLRLQADRNYLPNHPVFAKPAYVGDLQGTNTTTVQVSQLGWDGYDVLDDVGENTGAPETAITDDSSTVSVARKAISRNISDLHRVVDSMGVINNPASLARDAAMSAMAKLIDMVATLGATFAASGGPGSGNDLDVTSLLAQLIAMDVANNDGRMLAIIHSRQWGDVQEDMLAAVGTIAWRPATQEQISMRGGGFKGNLLGCDMYVSNRVPTANAGADRAGAIYTPGSIIWADATIPPDPHAHEIIVGGKVQVEFERDSSKWMKKITYNALLGASLGIDSRGRTLISDG